ncbi:flagellar biosynthesis anti-sigma factor FlgM [Plasticicumulans acidivorans]|uniref:Negative regulator of flagellin synthesis n=1 Tax=Plasticicumulans acidivorans TaxID=886464 RepID=A0A317MWS3_9GAMM|nr:flagellar biosynthesis anti-sigma factor FlgM [Plasticicumulans acidivorans]PWV63325.1 FlgM family anti-sigma-28 factor [Plasticicumulans acidivorans]
MTINNVGGPGAAPIRSVPTVKPQETTAAQQATPAGAQADAVAGDDAVSLTAGTRQLRDVERQLTQEEPAFDAKRVEALKQAVASGEYRVDSRRVAARLLDFENDLSR